MNYQKSTVKILEQNSEAEIYTTADCSCFNFHKGVQVNYKAQKPDGLS